MTNTTCESKPVQPGHPVPDPFYRALAGLTQGAMALQMIAGKLPMLLEEIRAAAEQREAELRALDRLPHDHEDQPIIPGEHRWVIGVNSEHDWGNPENKSIIQEVIVEGIGNDHDVLVGGLPGVNDEYWEVLDEELHGTREAAEAAKGEAP